MPLLLFSDARRGPRYDRWNRRSKNGGNEAADSLGNYLRRRQLGASRVDARQHEPRFTNILMLATARMPHRSNAEPVDLKPATPEDLAEALAFALRYSGRKAG
jgi:hypothetical protein